MAYISLDEEEFQSAKTLAYERGWAAGYELGYEAGFDDAGGTAEGLQPEEQDGYREYTEDPGPGYDEPAEIEPPADYDPAYDEPGAEHEE